MFALIVKRSENDARIIEFKDGQDPRQYCLQHEEYWSSHKTYDDAAKAHQEYRQVSNAQ